MHPIEELILQLVVHVPFQVLTLGSGCTIDLECLPGERKTFVSSHFNPVTSDRN